MNRRLKGVFQGHVITGTSNFWFYLQIFEDWFCTVLLPYFEKDMIGDTLGSHISLHMPFLCLENNKEFILLSPNATHFRLPKNVHGERCWAFGNRSEIQILSF